MTAYRFVTLTCDMCGEVYDDGSSFKVLEARNGAWREGWLYQHRQDLCPSCGYGRTRTG